MSRESRLVAAAPVALFPRRRAEEAVPTTTATKPLTTRAAMIEKAHTTPDDMIHGGPAEVIPTIADTAYRGRSRSPPRRRHEITKASEELRKTSTCLYVGNLPYSFREEDVSELFDRYGRLRNVSVPQDRLTGRNKGFAFVTFEDRRDAEDAKHKYDQSTVEGRRLRIDWDVGRDLKGLDNAPRPPIRDEASFASSRYP
ncbi:hypothetical protein BDZ88DRAFT_170602 [Geranomyces variabilis]|nr:hypothetical protein BDZ88DRAFT_170602 [Geranomyces variabilis]